MNYAVEVGLQSGIDDGGVTIGNVALILSSPTSKSNCIKVLVLCTCSYENISTVFVGNIDSKTDQ